MNRDQVKKLRDAVNLALKPLQDTYDLDIKVGNISFSDLEAKMQVIVVERSTDTGEDAQFVLYKRNAGLIGIDANSFNKVIKMGGKRFKLIEINTNSRRYPIIAENMDNGRRYKLDVVSVTNALAAQHSKSSILED